MSGEIYCIYSEVCSSLERTAEKGDIYASSLHKSNTDQPGHFTPRLYLAFKGDLYHISYPDCCADCVYTHLRFEPDDLKCGLVEHLHVAYIFPYLDKLSRYRLYFSNRCKWGAIQSHPCFSAAML